MQARGRERDSVPCVYCSLPSNEMEPERREEGAGLEERAGKLSRWRKLLLPILPLWVMLNTVNLTPVLRVFRGLPHAL